MTQPAYTAEEQHRLACELAGCQTGDVLKTRLTPEGELIVVIRPGPKFIYAAQQVTAAAERLAFEIGQIAEDIVGWLPGPGSHTEPGEARDHIAEGGDDLQLDPIAKANEATPGPGSPTAAGEPAAPPDPARHDRASVTRPKPARRKS